MFDLDDDDEEPDPNGLVRILVFVGAILLWIALENTIFL